MRAWPLACLCLLLPSEGRAGEVFLSGGLHAEILQIGPDWGAGLDVGLSAGWAPIPEVVLALQADLLVPLPSGQDERPADVLVRAAPTVGLRFGRDSDWGFVRAGLAFEGVVAGDELTPLMTFVAGAGYAVAPEELPFYFGFELVGEIELLGALRSRHIGLGGFLGVRL